MVAFVLLRVLLVLLLVAANAFFAAAEFALVSVRDTRIQQLIAARRIGARIVQRLHRNLDEVVNGVQLGVTVVSLTLGWIGEPMVAHFVESFQFLQRVPHALVYAHSIAIVIAFGLITFMHVILGELVPKSLALQRAEQVALAVAAPMEVFLTLTRPATFILGRSAGTVLRIFGLRKVRQGPVHSPDEVKLIVSASRELGQIAPAQEEMVHHALELENITAREVMVPRPDIFSLPGRPHSAGGAGTCSRRAAFASSGLRSEERAGAHYWSALCQGLAALGAPFKRTAPAARRRGRRT